MNKNLLLQIYVETDDLRKSFQQWSAIKTPDCFLCAKRRPRLLASETATIVVGYHLSGYKCIEYYYRRCILKTYQPCFPWHPLMGVLPTASLGVVPLLLLLLHKCSHRVYT